MKITLEPMFGVFLGGWEILLMLLSLLIPLVLIGGIIAIVIALTRTRKAKLSIPPPIQEPPPKTSAAPPTEVIPVKCPQCGTPLPSGALAGLCPACLLKMGAATDTVTDAKQSAFNPPTVAELAPLFPQLDILELIGKGGMGAVYKARQKQLDRIVALKILPPGIGSEPSFAERFAREAKALARLNHPNIVTLYEFGDAGGQFYFLMEFVDGMNLRQLLQASRVSAREALAIVPQICDALQFAHDQGIVHRDIKPENILMNRRGRVKVADFGLAKIVGDPLTRPADTLSPSGGEGRGEGATILTGAGKVMGTPQYMSPEQIAAPGEVDHRADIYALGVVFYQMLTGELPGKKIEPPSKKVHIDVRLDEIVLRALEKKPELRYQQASALKTQMETVAADNPELEARSQEPEAAPRFSRMAIVGVGFIVFALMLLGCSLFVASLSEAGFTEIFDNMTILELASKGLAALGTLCLLVSTLLGWVAVSQIRRLAGKLYGLWLAVFDGLLFPLLALDFLIWYLCIVSTLAFRNGFDVSGRIQFAAGALIVSVIISALADWLIVRAVWGALNKTASEKKSRLGFGLVVVLIGGLVLWGFASSVFQRRNGQMATGARGALQTELGNHVAALLNNERRITYSRLTFANVSGFPQRVVVHLDNLNGWPSLTNHQPRRLNGRLLLNFTPPNEWAVWGMDDLAGLNDVWHTATPGFPDWPDLFENADIPGSSVSFESVIPLLRDEMSHASIRFDNAHLSKVNDDNFLISFSGLQSHGVVNGKDAWVDIHGTVSARRDHGTTWDFQGLDQLAIVRLTVAGVDDQKLPSTNADPGPRYAQRLQNIIQHAGATDDALNDSDFGPVVNQLLPDDSAIDLVSGIVTQISQFTDPPPGGMDLAYSKNGQLFARAQNAVILHRAEWDTCGAQHLAELLRGGEDTPGPALEMDKTNSFDCTYGFKIRDGRLCLLKVTGQSKSLQHGVWIRYKLVQQTGSATNFYIGQAYFPKGDSIEISSVERTENEMTVKGHYNLISHDQASLVLNITTSTNIPSVHEGPRQTMTISKGQGDFELIDPHLVPGLPHVSMYADGHSFAALYFGTKAETLEESRAEWITNSSASAETWSPQLAPGEKPDLQKIRDEIKTLMEQNNYEEALQRQIWYFNHALQFGEVNPVRLSFGIMNWGELGQRYPKAKQALIEIRDRDVQEFSEGRGYSELFLEVQSLNRELHDAGATLVLFKTIYQQDKQLAGQCYGYAEDLLMQNGDHDLCLKCLGDPQARFESARRGFESLIELQQRMAEIRKNHPVPAPQIAGAFRPPDMAQLATNNFVGQVCKLVQILVATDHKAEAEKIQDEANAVLDDTRLKSAVSDAAGKIHQEQEQSPSDVVPASPDNSQLVMEATKFDIAHPEPGEMDWGFKCFVPPNHLASLLFVRWTNGVHSVDPGFSTYFKVGKAGGIDIPFCSLSCYRVISESGFAELTAAERRQRATAWHYPDSAGLTNAVRWNVNLGAGFTASRWIAMPPFNRIETKLPQSVQAGHQRVIRLVEFAGSEGDGNHGWSGVELRIFLEPLRSPPIRMLPDEIDQTNYVSGTGLAETMEEALNKIKNLPIDP